MNRVEFENWLWNPPAVDWCAEQFPPPTEKNLGMGEVFDTEIQLKEEVDELERKLHAEGFFIVDRDQSSGKEFRVRSIAVQRQMDEQAAAVARV